jgi:hypothetical protein
MKLNNGLLVNSYAKVSNSQRNMAPKHMTKPLVGSVPVKDIPSFAWKANMLPFGSIKLSVEEFKTKMQTKIDNIRNGTHKRKTVEKPELNRLKENAIKNITGPLVLECPDIPKVDLEALNKEFAKVKSVDDLYKLMDDPRIPANKMIIITEPYTENYAKFMAEVVKGNATNDVEQATAIVEAAAKGMEGDKIELPEIVIKVSHKEFVQNIIDYLKAGNDYDPGEFINSPYFNIHWGEKNELTIDLLKPVYER